jgi:hypothetical protein
MVCWADRYSGITATLVIPTGDQATMEDFMDQDTLKDIARMCEIILGNSFGNHELDSLAWYVGHHPLILNPGNAQQKEQNIRVEIEALYAELLSALAEQRRNK